MPEGVIIGICHCQNHFEPKAPERPLVDPAETLVYTNAAEKHFIAGIQGRSPGPGIPLHEQ